MSTARADSSQRVQVASIRPFGPAPTMTTSIMAVRREAVALAALISTVSGVESECGLVRGPAPAPRPGGRAAGLLELYRTDVRRSFQGSLPDRPGNPRAEIPKIAAPPPTTQVDIFPS